MAGYTGTPTGTVKITAARAHGRTVTLCTIRLASGTYHLTARYAGSADFSASRSAAKTLTIAKRA